MYKITVVYPKNLEDRILLSIGKFGWAELVNIREDEFVGFKKEMPLELHSFHLLMEHVEKLASDSGIVLDEYIPSVKHDVSIKIYKFDELQQELEELRRFFGIPSELEDLRKRLVKLRLIHELVRESPRIPKILSQKHSTVIIFPEDALDQVRENLSQLGLNFEILHPERGKYREFIPEGHAIAFLAAPSKDLLSIVLTFLRKFGISELEIDLGLGIEDEEARRMLLADPSRIKTTIGELESRIRDLEERFKAGFKQEVLKLAKLWCKADIMRKILTAKTMIVKGEFTAILRCWVPKERIDEFERILRELSANIMVIKERPSKTDKPPSHTKRPKILYPLTSILRQMGYPGKEDIFPWLLTGILWAIMFGFMFPDFGQGLALIAMGISFAFVEKIRRGVERLLGFSGKKVGGLLILAGSFATIFGIFFGEFFLTELYPPLIPELHEHWIKHMSSIKWVIKIALLIGIIEMFLAMLLFIYKNIKHKHFLEAILGEWALPGFLMYIGLLSLGFHFIGITLLRPIRIPLLNVEISLIFEEYGMAVLDLGNPTKSWPLYAFIGGIALLLLGGLIEGNVGEKFVALIEMPISMLSNTLSFSRLAGFLIGHAAFTLVLEKFAIMGSIAFGLGLILLNVLVILLEGLVVSLQSLRLLLYEFSTKWYLGEGRAFNPFRL